MGHRRMVAALAVVAATISLAAVASADGPLAHRPGIHFADDVPGDLQALASATWSRFLDAFPARWDCLADVTVTGRWTFTVRADYDPDRRLVQVRIPGTAPNLRATLVHEFAHHLDFSCPNRGLHRGFLAAQGLPPHSHWLRGSSWERIPSEQFAEAAVLYVLHQPPRSLTVVHPAAVDAIRTWARGGEPH